MTELGFSCRVTVPLPDFRGGKTWPCLAFIGDRGAAGWYISVTCFRVDALEFIVVVVIHRFRLKAVTTGRAVEQPRR